MFFQEKGWGSFLVVVSVNRHVDPLFHLRTIVGNWCGIGRDVAFFRRWVSFAGPAARRTGPPGGTTPMAQRHQTPPPLPPPRDRSGQPAPPASQCTTSDSSGPRVSFVGYLLITAFLYYFMLKRYSFSISLFFSWLLNHVDNVHCPLLCYRTVWLSPRRKRYQAWWQ